MFGKEKDAAMRVMATMVITNVWSARDESCLIQFDVGIVKRKLWQLGLRWDKKIWGVERDLSTSLTWWSKAMRKKEKGTESRGRIFIVDTRRVLDRSNEEMKNQRRLSRDEAYSCAIWATWRRAMWPRRGR
jgi:hypothetical protein